MNEKRIQNLFIHVTYMFMFKAYQVTLVFPLLFNVLIGKVSNAVNNYSASKLYLLNTLNFQTIVPEDNDTFNVTSLTITRNIFVVLWQRENYENT